MSATISPPQLLEQLKRAVEHCPMSRGELAEAAGISRKTLFNILEAGQDFRVSSLLALAEVLKLDITLSPRDTRGLRLDEPGQRGMSDHSLVGNILSTMGKDEKWK